MSFQAAQFREREAVRLFDFAADGEFPLCRIDGAGLVHVIADEEVLCGRKPATEGFHGGFQVEEAVGAHDQIFFAWNGDLGVRGPRDERIRGGGHQCRAGHISQKISSGEHGIVPRRKCRPPL